MSILCHKTLLPEYIHPCELFGIFHKPEVASSRFPEDHGKNNL